MGRCIYCGRCEEVCPTGAITLSPDFELSVMNKQDLFEQADYKLAACHRCGKYFAPVKEIEYAGALLRQSDLPEVVKTNAGALLNICPECKRKNDVSKMVNLYQENKDVAR